MTHSPRMLPAGVALALACTGAPPPPPPPPPEPAAPVPPSGAEAPLPAPPAMPPAPPMAHVRIVHASPDPVASPVAIYLDDQQSPVVPSLAYRSAAGYADVPAGEHAVAVRPAAAPAASPPVLAARTPALQGERSYTLVAHGLAGGNPALAIAAAEDNLTQPEAGRASIRVFHAIAGVGTVDLCAAAGRGATPVFPSLAYGAWGIAAGGQGNYFTAPASTPVTVQLRAQAASPCAGRLLGTAALTLPDRAVITAVAIGREGRPSVAPELLLCTDAPLAGPSTCTALPITPAGRGR